MKKIAIAGGPGSGKTSLSRALTNYLYCNRGLNVQYVSEFARDLINDIISVTGKYVPQISDQILIFEGQIERELLISKNVDYFVTDSPVFLPLIFTRQNIKCYQDGLVYENLYNKFHLQMNHLYKYDHIFFINHEKKYLKDGTRIQTEEEAKDIGKKIKGFMDFHDIKYHEVFGTIDERIVECIKIIGEK